MLEKVRYWSCSWLTSRLCFMYTYRLGYFFRFYERWNNVLGESYWVMYCLHLRWRRIHDKLWMILTRSIFARRAYSRIVAPGSQNLIQDLLFFLPEVYFCVAASTFLQYINMNLYRKLLVATAQEKQNYFYSGTLIQIIFLSIKLQVNVLFIYSIFLLSKML